jgi:hypothetical protein
MTAGDPSEHKRLELIERAERLYHLLVDVDLFEIERPQLGQAGELRHGSSATDIGVLLLMVRLAVSLRRDGRDHAP